MSETAPEAPQEVPAPEVAIPDEPVVVLADEAAAMDSLQVAHDEPGPTADGEAGESATAPAAGDAPAAPSAPEPEPLPADVPTTMAEATAGPAGISSGVTHPGILVRLRDVHAAVENFFARHPVLARELGIDLKSSLDALERPSNPGGQQ